MPNKYKCTVCLRDSDVNRQLLFRQLTRIAASSLHVSDHVPRTGGCAQNACRHWSGHVTCGTERDASGEHKRFLSSVMWCTCYTTCKYLRLLPQCDNVVWLFRCAICGMTTSTRSLAHVSPEVASFSSPTTAARAVFRYAPSATVCNVSYCTQH